MSLKIALERIRKAKETHASELDLSCLTLTEIPAEITKLTQLTELHLNNNQIDEIKGLEKLTQLSVLYLHGNQIIEIQGLEDLLQLTVINLSNNKIKEIKGLEKLTSLKILYLHKNFIREIRGLETLLNLTTLALDENHLTEIRGILNLVDLHTIYLNKNRISEIPEYLLQWDLPITLRSDRLNSIMVSDNPLTNPPPEIVEQGNEAIREYFEQRKKGDELLNEAKLILVGDGRSGKTSLANRLLDKDLPKEKDRTLGVDVAIGKYSFNLSNDQRFKINIWDFAGQDKYKALHQLFYTDSSLYVMVAESGNTTVDYNDWLQTAELFGEGSPLVLVLNEFKDGIGMSFDTNFWKRQFPDLLKEVVTVNLGTKQNFATAENFIRFYAQTLPHTKYVFPSNWAAIRRVLNDRRNEQYISLKEYLEICRKNGLPEKESALVLSSLLHKIGDCLHYQKNDLLKQFIILKNEWATDAVYKILEDQVVVEKNAAFLT